MLVSHYHDSFVSLSTKVIAADDPSVPSNGHLACDLDEIDKISSKTKNILIYHWRPSPELLEKIVRTALTDVPTYDDVIKNQDVEHIPEIFTHEPTKRIMTELMPAIRKLRDISEAKRFKLTIGVTQEQMCPLFHVDHNYLRLLTTLVGPGTEWLANKDVKRKGLGKGNNSKIVKPESMIQQLLTFQVGFLKGDLFPNNLGNGLVHRSPAVPPGTMGRWFIRMDALIS